MIKLKKLNQKKTPTNILKLSFPSKQLREGGREEGEFKSNKSPKFKKIHLSALPIHCIVFGLCNIIKATIYLVALLRISTLR